jgi:hypothetical protein
MRWRLLSTGIRALRHGAAAYGKQRRYESKPEVVLEEIVIPAIGVEVRLEMA